MRAVLTAIAQDGSFWSLGVRHAKLKTPLELVGSALRISAARLDGSTELAKMLARLGEPLFQESVPAGYSDDHGSVMFLMGGGVRGGSVYGRWPGLAAQQLWEGRDLAVTTDFATCMPKSATATGASRSWG